MDNEGQFISSKVQYSTVEQNFQIAVMTTLVDQFYLEYKDNDYKPGLDQRILTTKNLIALLLQRVQSYKLDDVDVAQMTETLTRIESTILKLETRLAQSTGSSLKPPVEIFRLSTVPLIYKTGSIAYVQTQTIRDRVYSMIFPLKNVKSDFVTAGSLFTLASDGEGISSTRSSTVGTRFRIRLSLPFGSRAAYFEVRMHCRITNERDFVIAEVPLCERLNSVDGNETRRLFVDVENYYTVPVREFLTFTPMIYSNISSTWNFYQSWSEAFFEVERLFIG